MNKNIIFSTIVLLVLGFSIAAGAKENEDGFWHDDQGRIDGEELMKPEERQEYRQTLWELKTQAERERLRDAYRQKVEERARTLGVPADAANSGKKEAGPKKWPQDGLRRWPEGRSADDGLHRWNGKHPLTSKESDKESPSRWPAREEGVQGTGNDPEEEKP